MSAKQWSVRLSKTCAAPQEVVYDILSDLRSHLEWGGSRQSRMFRLLSLDGPQSVATVGTTFTSTGAIPGSHHRWEDQSRVTQAIRPSVFEFVTKGTVRRARRRLEALYVHRYEVVPEGQGCRVTYVLRQQRIVNPFLRLRLPIVRTLTWKLGIPLMAGRGYRNLLAAAEQRAARGDQGDRHVTAVRR